MEVPLSRIKRDFRSENDLPEEQLERFRECLDHFLESVKTLVHEFLIPFHPERKHTGWRDSEEAEQYLKGPF